MTELRLILTFIKHVFRVPDKQNDTILRVYSIFPLQKSPSFDLSVSTESIMTNA